jgi:penicillin-binding protein 1A
MTKGNFGRKKTSGNKKKSGKYKGVKLLLKILLAVVLLFFLLVLTVYLGFLGKIPSSDELTRFKTPQASEVFSEDGKLLGRYYLENRSNVTYREISPNLVNALIATEDARFFKHRGVDEIALLRVFFKTLLFHNRSAGGGSTISQQIAKNLFPRNNIGIFTIPVSKIREAIIAYRLERIYSKEEILTIYLNTVPFGEGLFGIEVAAERFFSKPPSDLNVSEAAVLIGMLKANNVFNPRLHPGKSVERRNVVIDQMIRYKFISKAEGDRYKRMPLGLQYSLITYNQGPAPYFLEYIRPVLQQWCRKHLKEDGKPYNLYTDGLRIYTTVNYKMQNFATQAINTHMKFMQSVFDKHWKDASAWGDNQLVLDRAVKRSDRYKNGQAAGKNLQEIKKEFSLPVETSFFTWDGLKQVKTTPFDSLKHYLSMMNAGFIALENSTGAIKSYIGGIDYRFFKYDYCNAARQVGSTFKPIVYLAALESGLSPFDYYSSEQKTYEEYDNWSPSNASDDYSGYYTMKAALAHSINTVSVDIIMKTGIDNTIRTARNLGMNAELPEVPSLALGTASVSLKEMTSAFATIANLGKQVKPWFLLQIDNSRGEPLEIFNLPRIPEAKVDPENCRILIDMLRSVIEEGTGNAIRSKYNVQGDFAGKTGTTQEYADGWFIGFSPDYTAGCWVGADDPSVHFRNLKLGQGAYMALPVVGRFFSQMHADPDFKRLLKHNFESPDSLTLQQMVDLPENVDSADEGFNFIDFLKKTFSGKDTLQNEQKQDRHTEENEPVWEKIKKIFKKKEN